MNSSRLPGKVLLPILGKPALERMIERVRYSRRVDKIVVATTDTLSDDKIEELCGNLNISCYRGSENDVLSRVLEAVKRFKGDLICELTGDCPLIDPFLVDRIIRSHLSGSYDYTSNMLNKRTFPLGFETQVFSVKVLEKVSAMISDPIDRVHVSCFIYGHPELFRLNSVTADYEEFGPEIRVTLDTREDYELIKLVYETLYREGSVFTAGDVVRYLKENGELLNINKFIRQKDICEG